MSFNARLLVICISAIILQMPSQAAELSPSFGLSSPLVRAWWEGPAYVDSTLSLMKELGIQRTREDFAWEWFEYDSAMYDIDFLERYDSIIDAAAANGITVYGILNSDDNEDNWSLGQTCPSTEKHFQDYARHAAFMAERFKGKITYWEIWNEPDHTRFWRCEPNAGNYVQLLKHAYPAIKGVDSTIQVIGVSYSGSGPDFVTGIFDDGGLDFMDILSIHTYSYSEPGSQTTFEISSIYNDIDVFKENMKAADRVKPIWVTEAGVPTHEGDYGSTDRRQAAALARMQMALIAKGIEHVDWYDLATDCPDLTEPECNFGIIRSDLTLKPAYNSYKHLIQLLKGGIFVEERDVGFENMALVFRTAENKDLMAVWTYNEVYGADTWFKHANSQEILLSLPDAPDTVFDIFHNDDIPYTYADDTLRVTATDIPIFVMGDFERTAGFERTADHRVSKEGIQELSVQTAGGIALVSYRLSKGGQVKLNAVLFDGRVKADLVNAQKEAGYHFVEWSNLQNWKGICIFTLTIDGSPVASCKAVIQ